MTEESDPVADSTDGPDDPPVDRESPVGEPVVRGDRAVTGRRAEEAVEFDPEDPDSVARAASTVADFAVDGRADADSLHVLQGAAAAAALVRGEGSYRGAAARAGEDVSVSFIRKWARVHDLPRSIRRAVAAGRIAPSAAKHIARVGGEDRYLLAWATLDADLTVREVRQVASAVNDGTPIDRAIGEADATLGRVTVNLPPAVYRELRRRAIAEDTDIDTLVGDALARTLGPTDS